MKYVILIHSNPQPWGHPTSDYVAEHQALPQAQRDALQADFERVLTELSERGELLGGEALADPGSARLYRWGTGRPLATDGPYAETKEYLGGLAIVDVADEAAARRWAGRLAEGCGWPQEVRRFGSAPDLDRPAG